MQVLALSVLFECHSRAFERDLGEHEAQAQKAYGRPVNREPPQPQEIAREALWRTDPEVMNLEA